MDKPALITDPVDPGDKLQPLKQLRRVCAELPEDRLHMRAFCEAAPCGTAVCLAGAAALDPWFQTNTRINDFLRIEKFPDIGYHAVAPNRRRATFEGLGAACGIGREDAEDLFGAKLRPREDAAHAVTKAEVLANIDRLLAGRSAVPYAAIAMRSRPE